MQLRHNEEYHSILLVDFLLLVEPKQKQTMTRILSLLDQRHLVEQVVHNRLDLVEVVLDKVLAGSLDLGLVDQILVVAVAESVFWETYGSKRNYDHSESFGIG